jgi:hypothetical protein
MSSVKDFHILTYSVRMTAAWLIDLPEAALPQCSIDRRTGSRNYDKFELIFLSIQVQ